MSDRHLFKAKRIDNGEWVYGGYRTNGMNNHFITVFQKSDGYFIFDEFEIKEETLCQCTGLKDRNGNLIWENDIVMNEKRAGVVKFGEYSTSFFGKSVHFGFRIEWQNNKYLYLREDIKFWLPKIKNISNIFDNPELLEDE